MTTGFQFQGLPVVALGPHIPKANGDPFSGVLNFQHQGAGGDFDVGFGVAYDPAPTWAAVTITLPDEAAWTPYSVAVSGIFQTTTALGVKIGTRNFIQTKGGVRNIGGGGMLCDNAAADVYYRVQRGVQLSSGWNNNIVYTGSSNPIAQEIASISQYVVRVWVYRGGNWLMYDPADLPGSTLTSINNGESVDIEVSQACFWSW